MEFFRRGRIPEGIQAENQQLAARIAAINNLDPSEVRPRRIKAAYKASFDLAARPSFRNVRASRYLDRYLGDITGRALAENFQQFGQLTEAMLDLPPTFYSYGLFGPSYINGLQRQRQENPSSEHPHKALLVGALSKDTIKEFAASVRLVHPDASCVTVDIVGETTRKIEPSISSFIFGDGLQLPFADGAFDSIHTNILLSNLTDNPELTSSKVSDFFSETARVLADTGWLFLAEVKDSISKKQLQPAGFSLISKTSALEFPSRRVMERAFRSTVPFEFNNAEPSSYVDFVIASK